LRLRAAEFSGYAGKLRRFLERESFEAVCFDSFIFKTGS
jgi:hypothetical protein